MSLSNPEYSESKILRPINLHHGDHAHKGSLRTLMLGAIGVVFGDIATSPLYALKECFSPQHGIPFSNEAVFGVISMVFWAFMVVVSIKYVMFIMRASNNGEGGILALMALALRTVPVGSKSAMAIMMLGVFGAAMFYGDAVITPAISVLSAVEGLEVVSPELKRFVIPITLIILIGLFLIQKRGTSVVGILFGPIMVIWFLVLGLMGLVNIIDYPQILAAVNPYFAVTFLYEHSLEAFIVLGAVFLVLTGAEALYTDMGHFGIKPIRYVWFFITLPCLLLNYFGQGAFLINNPEAIVNPFFLMVPEAVTFALVLLATVATVIASQAVISGTYSMTSQAILLGFIPKMKISYTSDNEIGQIYMPTINWLLLFMVVVVVITFKSSANLAAAYGIAVTTTMIIDTILAAIVMSVVWKWNPTFIALVIGAFIAVDLSFFSANLLKVAEGGWFPILVGGICFLFLMTWYQGRKILREKAIEKGIPLEGFVKSLQAHPPHRVEGTAVFLTAHVDFVPVAMLHNLKHNRILHERIIFLKISTWDVPYVEESERITFKDMGSEMYLARAIYGFKETPDMLQILNDLAKYNNLECDLMETSFFLARDTVIASAIPGMPLWREKIFASMFQNAAKPSDFYQIPTNRVVELGAKIEI
ncbi:MAG: potassium transporter Kup [Polynucleobacter sp.]|nr:potassium transporter Kup [Polynucleobacter sp.]